MGQDKGFEQAAATTAATDEDMAKTAVIYDHLFGSPPKLVAEAAPAPDTTGSGGASGASGRTEFGVIEHFPELDKKAEDMVAQLSAASPKDAFALFERLGTDSSLQKYTAAQVADALGQAQLKQGGDQRFEFWASNQGLVTVYDAQNPRKPEVRLAATQMYGEAELKALDASKVEPDEDRTRQIAKSFADADLASMTPGELGDRLSAAAAQMKAANADPRFAASELSDALDDAGLAYSVDNRHGQLTLNTIEHTPWAGFRVKKG